MLFVISKILFLLLEKLPNVFIRQPSISSAGHVVAGGLQAHGDSRAGKPCAVVTDERHVRRAADADEPRRPSLLADPVHKRLEDAPRAAAEIELDPATRRAVIVHAMQEVGPSLFFSLLVITIAFLPIFTLESTEGRLFKPLAFTKTYSMGFSAVLAVTLTPALMALFVRGRILKEEKNPVNRVLIALYTPVVRAVVRHRRFVIGMAVAAS